MAATIDESRFEELSDSDIDLRTNEHTQQIYVESYVWPMWLDALHLDTIGDELTTNTSKIQQQTQAECMPYLMLDNVYDFDVNSHGLPHLNRAGHIKFLHKSLEPLSAGAQGMDAARPWFFYWTLQGMTAMGEDVSMYRDRLITTLRPLQNVSGGFAGGHGQNSHCAPSYSCVLALAMVGGLDMIDRTSMWHFLGQVKQPDGGFKVAVMAEEDIRGAYCAMTIISLLNLPLDLPQDAPARQHGLKSFSDGLSDWIARCQTYEGGIGGAPTNEAHGAYAFCALACLSILDAPERSIPACLDVPALEKWIVDIQTTPEGGFAGRTNKLVDSCYSHWVGGCWALLNAARQRQNDLWNRAGLIRYLLTCCQKAGKVAGMRDKPSTRPDAYHTCYALAGLSAATHHLQYQSSEDSLAAPYCWISRDPTQAEMNEWLIDQDDLVHSIHPVFVIPFGAVERTRSLFQGRGL
ncbi:hypothetical protein AMS68_004232 [Peltaster fructicola]|uniref:Protein farnesyltransferase subunit beta n=1 Tax=Peltaster fructicola TaxID=286661 RepID=A0A6H0XVN2_9PEZI|nr:hypothetical protein AMS68_004232 [Peltaster fructicola]